MSVNRKYVLLLHQKTNINLKLFKMNTVIRLEDNGQDFLEFMVNDEDVIIEVKPFQNSIWSGAYVPLNMVMVGKELPIHKPPHIEFGFLKHKVESIKQE